MSNVLPIWLGHLFTLFSFVRHNIISGTTFSFIIPYMMFYSMSLFAFFRFSLLFVPFPRLIFCYPLFYPSLPKSSPSPSSRYPYFFLLLYYYSYYFSCNPTMCSMIFNIDHSEKSRKKKTSETNRTPAPSLPPFCAICRLVYSICCPCVLFLNPKLRPSSIPTPYVWVCRPPTPFILLSWRL